MAPTLSKFTEVRERLISQVLTFLNTPEANFFGQTIRFLDHAPELSDIWATTPTLAIWWSADDAIQFVTEGRRMTTRNTTSVPTMNFRGYTLGDWSAIEALEVDCRRAVLERPGLGCAATASLWDTLQFSIEVQHRAEGQDRRASFSSTLALEVVEDITP